MDLHDLDLRLVNSMSGTYTPCAITTGRGLLHWHVQPHTLLQAAVHKVNNSKAVDVALWQSIVTINVTMTL